MSETPDGRGRPTPRPRPGAKPSPRPRVAGSRRDRDDPAPRAEGTGRGTEDAIPSARATATARPTAPRTAVAEAAAPAGARRFPALALVLTLLCLAAAAGGGFLLWQRLNPTYVDSSIFAAARDGVRALYAYDYEDSEGSVQGKLDVLTGELRDQYEEDLGQGGIIDTYEQVSATTSYEVLEVGLQQVNDAQDTATLVVFGQYVVKSVNSGDQAAPEGSECLVTPDGAQSCTQTVRVRVVQVDGDWKIDELTLLTTS
jgi:co-chaperonin GroES (HSP10)